MRANASRMRRWWKGAGAAEAEPFDRMAAPPEAPAPTDIYERLHLPRTLNYPATTIGSVLDQSADRFPHAPAMVFGGRQWTYRELADEVNRLATSLADRGVGPGDHVLMTLPNCPDFVRLFLALQKLGTIVVNAGPLMGRDDLRELIAMTRPRILVGLDLQARALRDAAGEHADMAWVWSSLQAYQPLLKRLGYRMKRWQARDQLRAGDVQITLDDLVASGRAEPIVGGPRPDDVAVLQPTGGTTGTLKVAQLTHRSLLCNAAQLSAWASLRPGQERLFAVLPMFHVYGLMISLLLPIYNASATLPMPRFELKPMLALVRDHRPTVVPIVPAIIDLLCRELTANPDEEVLDVLRQTFVLSGAAPLPAITAQRFERLTGNRVVQGYGLTEASPVTHANPLAAPRDGSIGLPMPDTQMRIADLTDPTRDADGNEPGELVVRGPQLMLGYYRNPEETARMLREDDKGDTWLHTGDVAHVDADGYVYLVDRRKHMINHAGLKVWPAKIEQMLVTHDDVADAAVLGRPDVVHGEAVTAVIVAREGVDTSNLADELRTMCRERLAPYEVPSRFEFVMNLPRSPLGKLLKHRLDAQASAAGDGHHALADPPDRAAEAPSEDKEREA